MPVDYYKSLGEMLHGLRRERRFTQQDLAEKLGTSNSHISKWESGTNMPSDEYIVKIAKALEVPTEILLDKKRSDLMNQYRDLGYTEKSDLNDAQNDELIIGKLKTSIKALEAAILYIESKKNRN